MSTLPCLYCDGPIPASEIERASLCPLCSRPIMVSGVYRPKRLLSQSESDRVYAAVRDGSNLEVAVKVLLARDDDWATISEFERMARTLQSMRTKVVPQILAWEKGGRGRLIIVREELRGQTLEERIRGGQRPGASALRKILEDLLSLLADLHKLSPPLLHRDIRPANILFRETSNWWPVLVDFDPRAGSATIESDLAALGKTMEFAAGGNLGSLRSVVEGLNSGRFASANDALNAIRTEGNRESTFSPPPSSSTPPPIAPRGASPRAGMVIVGLLVAAGAVFGFLSSSKNKRPETTTTTSQKTTSTDKLGDSTVRKYRSQCDDGNSEGCYNLGYRYEKGKGIAKNESVAASLYKQSCDMKYAMACNNLGVLYETGRGVPKDPAMAATLYQRSCDQKDWLACRNLGYLYSNGIGVQQDGPRSVELYETACKHGEIKACYNLGWVYEHGKPGVAMNMDNAIKLYQQACDGEDYAGCTAMGWLYANGKGVQTDQLKAFAYYTRACDHDDATGCNNLGAMYAKGTSVTKDNKRAFTLYERGCNGGDHYGCCNLGYFYEVGTACEKDLDKATELYQKSCMMGYDKCCNNFVDMVKDKRTHETGLALIKKACADGNRWNCDQLEKLK